MDTVRNTRRFSSGGRGGTDTECKRDGYQEQDREMKVSDLDLWHCDPAYDLIEEYILIIKGYPNTGTISQCAIGQNTIIKNMAGKKNGKKHKQH
jgi:hypothetical protein